MKQARNAKVGDLVQVPVYNFAPMRSGWNGWLFSCGIITEIGISKKTGNKIIKVEFPTRDYGQTLYNMAGEEVSEVRKNTLCKWFQKNAVFEYDTWRSKEVIKKPREIYCHHCYDVDTEFLLDRGLI